MGDDYSFLQEKIKDEAGSPKTLRKKIFRMILLGFFFGIVACFTFFAFKPWLEGILGQNTEEIFIPEDEITVEEDGAQQQEEDAQEGLQTETEEQVQKKLLKTLQNTAKDLRPGIVLVSGQRKQEENTQIKRTSGVIIADNGSELLVVSQILGSKIKSTKVTFADGSECAATWKMYDENMKIGICAVSKEDIANETWGQIEIVQLGNSFRTETGDAGIVIGVDEDGDQKVSFGFISTGDEKIDIADGNIGLLRVDVAGAVFRNGMVFNQDGKMIGIIGMTEGGKQTHVMAYSISDIKKEMELMSNGKVVPFTGIWGIVLPDELKAEGLEAGICVHEIDTDSAAMEAGIQCGDVIVKVGDTEVSSMKEYRTALLKEQGKHTVVLTGLRKGADNKYVEMDFSVVIDRKQMTD